jgi:hypothetical protein
MGIFMKIRKTLVAAVILASTACAQSAYAGVIFSDNFNGYAQTLNWVPPANWASIGPGDTDIIGTGFFDFYPGNGNYVDLDGSNGSPGQLDTLTSFAAGSYTLTFDLGGNARGDVDKTTDISLGSWSTALTLASGSPYSLYTYTFATTGGTLDFSDLPGGNGNIGNILDNVTLATAVSTVPEPLTISLFGTGLAGAAALRRRKKKIA